MAQTESQSLKTKTKISKQKKNGPTLPKLEEVAPLMPDLSPTGCPTLHGLQVKLFERFL